MTRRTRSVSEDTMVAEDKEEDNEEHEGDTNLGTHTGQEGRTDKEDEDPPDDTSPKAATSMATLPASSVKPIPQLFGLSLNHHAKR
jgi:hypothetical protein